MKFTKNPQIKQLLTLLGAVFLLATLGYTLFQLGKTQLYQKKASLDRFTDEQSGTIADPQMQFYNGFLASKADTLKLKQGQAFSTEAQEAQGKESRLTLPSVQAFSSDSFTGTSTISYPLITFPGLGGLTPSVSLSYNSGTVDDLHLYYHNWMNRYTTQAGLAGLGWSLGGISFIARDNTTYPNRFMLVFPGGATELFKEQGDQQSSTWQSNPKLFIKVRHLTNNTHAYYDTNPWIITTQDGTKYVFGAKVDKNTGEPQDLALTPLTLAKPFDPTKKCTDNNRHLPYKWYLREVIDTNGNKITYQYDKEINTYYGACVAEDYVSYTYPKKIIYNNNKTVIEFNYEERKDFKTEDFRKNSREECPEFYSYLYAEFGDYAPTVINNICQKQIGFYQLRIAKKRLSEIKIRVNNKQARRYKLNYRYSETSEGVPTGHSLLTTIDQFGTDNKKYPTSYTFSYSDENQGGFLNSVYLTSADNGYGGKVEYAYQTMEITFCDKLKIGGCNIGRWGAERKVVTKKTTFDGEGNSYQTTINYQDPNAFVKTPGDSTEFEKCKRKEGQYDSWPEGRCHQVDVPFSGFEFLGFGKVTEKLHALNNPRKIETSSRTYFHQAIDEDQCFAKDPRSGRSYKTEVLDSTNKALVATENHFQPSPKCSEINENSSFFVRLTQTDSLQVDPSIGNKKTTVKNYYNDNLGVVVKTENLGDIKEQGDEKYSFTDYVVNENKWIIKPSQTYISDHPQGRTKYNLTRYFYDNQNNYQSPPKKGLLTKTTLINQTTYRNPEEITTTISYYNNGQPKKTTDALGNTTITFYDNKIGALPTKVVNPLNQAAETKYLGKDYLLALPTLTYDISKRVSKTEYDSFGRILAVYGPDDKNPQKIDSKPQVIYEYFDPKPYIRIKTRVFEDNYQINDQIYNGLGQLLQDQILATYVDKDNTGLMEEKGLITQTKYNSRGQTIEQSLPVVVSARSNSAQPQLISLGSYEKTTTSYDELGRSISSTDPLNRTTRTNYKDFTTTIIDPANHVAKATADGLGRTILTESYKGAFGSIKGDRIITKTEYDPLDNPIRIIQRFPDNQKLGRIITAFKYDLFGRKIEMNDPDLGNWKFKYDDNNNLISQIDAKNQEITFKYDPLNRLTKKIYPKKPYPEALSNVIEYKYDNKGFNALGKRHLIKDLTGFTQYRYDKKGRLKKMIKRIDEKITGKNQEEAHYTYTYYSTDQIKTYKYPDGEILTYTYDKYGNQKSITGKEKYLADTSLDKFGNPTKIDYGQNLIQTRRYDLIGRLSQITTTQDNKKLFNSSYQYDVLNNIVSVKNNPDEQKAKEQFSYAYDSLSQLTKVAGTYGANYIYDEAGNMWTKKEDEKVEMTYNLNHPVHAPKTVNGFTYKYDPNGNLLEDEERIYKWDYDNKPIEIKMKKTNKTVKFYYDGEGERVVKKEF